MRKSFPMFLVSFYYLFLFVSPSILSQNKSLIFADTKFSLFNDYKEIIASIDTNRYYCVINENDNIISISDRREKNPLGMLSYNKGHRITSITKIWGYFENITEAFNILFFLIKELPKESINYLSTNEVVEPDFSFRNINISTDNKAIEIFIDAKGVSINENIFE